MAVKVLCKIDVVAPSQVPGAAHFIIGFAGLEPGNTTAGSMTFLDQPADISVAQLSQLVSEFMFVNYGYLFGPEDSVRFLGTFT